MWRSMISSYFVWNLLGASLGLPPIRFASTLFTRIRAKDGGVFVEFEYTPASDPKDTVSVLAEIQEALRKAANDHGGIPSWLGLRQGNIWLVKGRPWKEVNSLSWCYEALRLIVC